MSKRAKKDSWLKGGFVALSYEELESNALKSIGGILYCYTLCLRKVKCSNKHDRYKTEFTFTYREAAKYGFGSKTFSRYMNALHEKGMIDVVLRGGLAAGSRVSTLYRLSQRWRNFGKGSFEKRHAGYQGAIHEDKIKHYF